VNLAKEFCEITFSKLSVKSFFAKALSDHLSNFTSLCDSNIPQSLSRSKNAAAVTGCMYFIVIDFYSAE